MFNARSGALIVHAHAVLPQVSTEHLLLGLIEEDVLSKAGYLNSGMDAEKAKQAIEELTGKRKPVTSADPIVFSRGVRRTFEAATTVRGLATGSPQICTVWASTMPCSPHHTAPV